MAPKTPRLKILSGLSSHPILLFTARPPPSPSTQYAHIPTLALRPSQFLVSFLQVILFLPKPRLAKTIPSIDSNFLSLFFFSWFLLFGLPKAPQPESSSTDRVAVGCSTLYLTSRYE